MAGTWRQRARAGAFLVPALAFIAVWVVYPTVWTIIRSLFDRSGADFVGLANYRTLVTSDTLVTAIQNNALWLLVVPATVTAIGLVLAVLTEQIRWAVAFRTVVFMPMAISMFAAGVIWHVMDDRDPERGAVNAAVKVVRETVSGAGVLTDARASTPQLSGTPRRGFVSKATVHPGASASIGLTAIPAGELPAGATQARTPPRRPGAITGTVWRDFRPGGGRPGVVEPQERGVPGATVELRDRAGKTVASTQSARDGAFAFEHVAAGAYSVVLSSRTFAAADPGIAWLGPGLVTPAIMIAYIWVWAGFAMVLIAAGLAAIPRDVLEAARIDGADERQVFRRVTVPLLAPVLSVVLITMVIYVLKVFDIVLAVAPGSSQDDANVIALAMWRTSFGGVNDFGLGSAIAVLLLVLVLPALILNIRRFQREAAT